jgi:anti-sigma regulatory factor (Ser/Thr protein kinase)
MVGREAVTTMARTQVGPGAAHHYGMRHALVAEFVDAIAAPVSAAVQQQQPVLAVVDSATERELRKLLGRRGEAIEFHRPEAVFAGSAQTATFTAARGYAELGATGPATVITRYPPWMDPYGLALRECCVNSISAGGPLTLLCGYAGDRAEQAKVFIATHPRLWGPHGVRRNPAYRDPSVVLARHPAPAPKPLREPDYELDFDRADLRTLRRFITHHGLLCGLDGVGAEYLALGVDAVATNSVEHGAGHGWARLWHEPPRLICEIHDPGHFAPGQLPGLSPPSQGDRRGRGLWLARSITDELYLWHDDAGTTVRLRVHHPDR